MLTIKKILARKGNFVASLPSSTSVLNALQIMSEKNFGSIVVMDNGEYKGILTERDYARKVILLGKSSSETSVAEIMSVDLPKVSPSKSVVECMQIMSDNNIRYLPVFEDNKLVGIISINDAVYEIIHSQKEIIEQLQSYIHS